MGVTAVYFSPTGNTKKSVEAMAAALDPGYKTADLTGYPDYSSISGYARTPMSWAVARGVICGVGNANGVTTLEPKGDATRAQTAAIIMRFCQNVL